MGVVNRPPAASVLISFNPGFWTSPLYSYLSVSSSAHHLIRYHMSAYLARLGFVLFFDLYPLNRPHRFSSFMAFIRFSHYAFFLTSPLFPLPLPTFLIEAQATYMPEGGLARVLTMASS